MTQHITQEVSTQIAAQFAEDATYEVNIANAAIQHYLDQRAKELPVLPEPAVTNDNLKEMESKVDYWRAQHADLGLKYDNLRQAFHIAETDVKLWRGTAKKARVDALEEAIQAIRALWHGDGDGESKCIYAIEALRREVK